MNNRYKYEVAFSFLEKDRHIAEQIIKELNNQFSYFIYTEHQDEIIASEDPVVYFKKVYGKESRVAVILYRKGWGDRGYTYYEMTAIRERAHDKTFGFTIMIMLGNETVYPEWYERLRIYKNYEKSGAQGFSKILEYKIQELGGEAKTESVSERAERIANEIKQVIEINHILNTPDTEGIKLANEELNKLFKVIETKANDIKNSNTLYSDFKPVTNSKSLQLKIYGYTLHIYWSSHSNSLTNSKLIATIYNYSDEVVFQKEYNFCIDISKNKGWIDRINYDGGDIMITPKTILQSSESVAEKILNELLNNLEIK